MRPLIALLATALLTLGLLGSAEAAGPRHPGAGASVISGCDSLCALFGTLSRGQWKQIMEADRQYLVMQRPVDADVQLARCCGRQLVH
jgi:hypothetical protein